MKRENLKIGQKVLVIPENKNSPPKELYVRELHNPHFAGLSHTMDSPPEKSYGIYYRVIHPINKFKLWGWHFNKWLKDHGLERAPKKEREVYVIIFHP